MKKRLLLFVFAVLLAGIPPAQAQLNATMSIVSAHQVGQTVQLTITSTKPFRMGGNVYVLHIGDRTFSHSRQYKKNGKGRITFRIPMDDYDGLSEGLKIYLTYGRMNDIEEDELDELARHNKAWYLGSFSPSMLN